MSAATRPGARERLMLYLDPAVWRRAEQQAAADGLTTARALELLLDGQAKGTVTAAVPAKRHRAARKPTRVSLARNVLDAVAHVDDKGTYVPRKADARSLSVLAELLLAGYADEQVTVTASATGHAAPTADDETAPQ